MESQIIKERGTEVMDLDDSQLEALMGGPMSDPLREALNRVLDQRKNSGSSSR